MTIESIEIKAKDDYILKGKFFPCENENKKNPPVIAIHPAFGIKCGFYSPLAKFLSKENHVFIFDYRGIGESGDPKLVHDGMHSWATLDMVALHNYIEKRFPESDLHIIGHSGGAWLLGFIPPTKNLKSLVFICMPNGYFNSFSFPNNIRLYLTWKFWIPRIVKKNGILGNSKFYSGAPLPGNIALDWAASGLKKKFIEDDSFQPNGKFIKDYTVPTLAFTFSDDQVCDAKSTFSMLAKFSNLKKTHRHIHPKEIDEAEIGHYGFLKPSQKKKLWIDLLKWFNQF